MAGQYFKGDRKTAARCKVKWVWNHKEWEGKLESEGRARLAAVSQVTDERGSQEELEGDQMAYLRGPWHVCVGEQYFLITQKY